MVWKLIRRNVVSKPFRFLLTSLAVTVGVMFTVGVFVFTDSLRATFSDLSEDLNAGYDLSVRSEIAFGSREDAPHVPVELEEQLLEIDGVRSTQGTVLKFGVEVLDSDCTENPDCERLGRGFWVGSNYQDRTPSPLLFLVDLDDQEASKAPEGPDEFILDADTIDDEGYVVGESYTVLLSEPRSMTLVGAFNLGDAFENLLIGQRSVAFETAVAVDELEFGEGYDEIQILVDDGVDEETVITRIQPALPSGFEVVTAEFQTEEQTDEFSDAISIFRTVMLVFAFIILGVAAFVIYNVFTILIGQRIRELGLLRAIGASGSQVTRALLGEAVLVGVASTVIGAVAGIGLGWALRRLLVALDFGPEVDTLVIGPWTLVWAVGVGIGVTLASAVVPAMRARDVAPMAALRDDARLTRRTPAVNQALGAGFVLTAWALVVLAVVLDGLDLPGFGRLPSWATAMVLGVVAAGVHVVGMRRLGTRAGQFALFGFGLVMLVLSLVLDLGTARVLSLLAVAAVTLFLGTASISPMLSRPAANALGRWPLSLLVGAAGVPVTIAGAAGLVGSAVLVAMTIVELVTSPDLTAVYLAVGALVLGLLAFLVMWVGIRSIDASFILGWRPRQVLAGILTFLVGAVGALAVLAGLARLATGEGAGAAILAGGLVGVGIAVTLRRWLPLKMKSNARMARENAGRSPRRTASAAAALMIGLALVTAASVVAESFKATFAAVLEDSVTSDWFISSDSFDPDSGFPSTVGDRFETLEEVDTVVRFKFEFEAFRVVGQQNATDATGTDLLESLDHIDPDFVAIDESLIDRNAIFIHEDTADDNDFGLGSTFAIEFVDGTVAQVRVAGIYADSAIYGNRAIDLELWDDYFADQEDQFLSIISADGVSEEQVRGELEAQAVDFPQVTIETRDEFQESQEAQIDQFLTVINVLLGIAVIVALLGIAITLALSVFERTRELGLVRAVGMTTRQMMRMVLFEGAIIAAFGGVLGVVLGLVFGIAAVAAIPDAFIDTLGLSVTELVIYVVVAAVAGIGAAIIPARRASRLDVLEAIAQE